MDSFSVKISEIPKTPDGCYLMEFYGGGIFPEWKGDIDLIEAHTTMEVRGEEEGYNGILGPIVGQYLSFPDGFEGFVSLVASEDDVFVKGRIITSVKNTCSRCAESFEDKMDIPFEYIISMRELKDKDIELKAEDLELDFLFGDELDIGRLICEQVSLSLPVQPLCSEDCMGLCRKCGINLNIKKCGCENEMVDIRFEKLKDFQVK
jgi:uncharacterized protein